MYSYTYDAATGGILMNSSPTVFSKEPRPVWAAEMNLLGFSQYWDYDKQNDIPYMWAESNVYWYRGIQIAKIKGGNLYTAPELIPLKTADGRVPFSKEDGETLQSIDIPAMCRQNESLMTIVESSTVNKIVKEYEKFKERLDIFHVAFSGGKDSAVLLDLIKKALPVGSFVVIFGDTGMEFPDTYDVVNKTKAQCEKDGTPFYIARSHFEPSKSWKLFGPPARVLRWCCSVHKSTPQTLKMREITGKDDYIGMDFVGVRAHESVSRSKYEYENFGKKQKGQYSYNPILEWTSAEVWLYIFMNNVLINETYKKGNSRAGCLFCPMRGWKGDYFQNAAYPNEIGKYISLIKQMNVRDANNEKALNSYVSNGGWNARKNGRDLIDNPFRCIESVVGDHIYITVIKPSTDWKEWIKTIGNLNKTEDGYTISYKDKEYSFSVNDNENGYVVLFASQPKITKGSRHFVKLFRQVFRRAAYCGNCRVCETNCQNGCISFVGKLRITGCIQCGQCHEIDSGCLLFHSRRLSTEKNRKAKEEK